MIRIFVIALFFMAISNNYMFDIDLKEVKYSEIDNSVIVVCDNLYCHDCLGSLKKIQHIWKDNYKTVLITKSRTSKRMALAIKKGFESKLHFDEIYFLKAKKYLGFSKLRVNNYEFAATPAIIIKENDSSIAIPSKTLFSSNYDTLSIKRILLKYLNSD